jgi:hypothetical protein
MNALSGLLPTEQLLYTRYHGKRITFAYGTFFPYRYRAEFPELQGCPDRACIELLQKWGVNYLLLNLADRPAGPDLESELDNSSFLQRVDLIGPIVVYQLAQPGASILQD